MNVGLWQDAGRRLRANFGALLAMCILAILVVLAILGPWFNPNDIEALDWSHVASGPGLASAHWFGTDRLGRDLFVRTLDGARVSLAVGLIASAVSLGVGLSYGAVAGYVGGRTDHLMMRIIEILSGLPLIFFVIFLTVIFGRSESLLFLSIGAVGWLTMARIVRGQTLSIRRREFIEAAVAGGAGTWRIIFKHVVPNVIGPVIVYATLDRTADHFVREFPELFGPRHSRAAREPRDADRGGRRGDGSGAVDTARAREFSRLAAACA